MHPKSMTTSSPASTCRALGRACGFAAFGPDGDDRIEAVAARAAATHLDLELEREVALGGSFGETREERAERVVGDGTRGVDARDLGRLLDPPEPLDETVGGDELVAVERDRERALLRPRDRVRFESDARTGRERGGERVALLRDGGADLDLRVDARRGELLPRLRAVPAVGGEHERVVGDEQHRRAAGEAGEVAHVGEVGDEQRVDAGVGEQRAETRGAAGDVHRAAARRARRWPSRCLQSCGCDGALDREAVAGAAEPGHGRGHVRRDHGVVAPVLARLGVGDVELDLHARRTWPARRRARTSSA